MSGVNPFLIVGFFSGLLVFIFAVIFGFCTNDEPKQMTAFSLALVTFILVLVLGIAGSEQWRHHNNNNDDVVLPTTNR